MGAGSLDAEVEVCVGVEQGRDQAIPVKNAVAARSEIAQDVCPVGKQGHVAQVGLADGCAQGGDHLKGIFSSGDAVGRVEGDSDDVLADLVDDSHELGCAYFLVRLKVQTA